MSRQLERAMLLAVVLGAATLWIMFAPARTVPSGTSYLPADHDYYLAAFCGDSPVKGGDADEIAAWGAANHVRCAP